MMEREFHPFTIDDVFEIRPGKRLVAADSTPGTRPFIGALDNNNGVARFVSDSNESLDSNVLGVNYNGNGMVIGFYHPYDCIFSDDVKRFHLRDAADGRDVLLYVKVPILMQKSKFGYLYKFNAQRMEKTRVMLPVSNGGKPDWEYMSSSSKTMRKALLARYRQYAEERVSGLEHVDIPSLDAVTWAPVRISDLFDEIVPGKGKGLNHLAKSLDGTIPYIGATNRNNGVMCFVVDNPDCAEMVLPGNCIGFIKNGDGSAGYAIYKRESFISTNDVIYGYGDKLNEYVSLFIVVAQDMIEHKYSHGYKRNRERLLRDRIMLPVTDEGDPDYTYMEQYSKNMMLRKYQQYLAYLDAMGGLT